MGAASDGDGDRNMILGRRFFVSPGDSLAVLAWHARSIPGYAGGLAGVARSMPTSQAVDRVAAALNIPCFETPTGWKFFGNLMDAGKITLCGEESFGTGSSHVREKDGLWAVLCWLSLAAETRAPIAGLVQGHWQRFGRSFFQRHDYDDLDETGARDMMAALAERLSTLPGTTIGGETIAGADDLRYQDPIDGSVSEHQGLRVQLQDGSRLIFRLSGTGSDKATARIYLERFRTSDVDADANEVLAPLAAIARSLLDIEARCGRREPTLVT
jgi:phosphoglucomutase